MSSRIRPGSARYRRIKRRRARMKSKQAPPETAIAGEEEWSASPLKERGFENPNFGSIAAALDGALDQDWGTSPGDDDEQDAEDDEGEWNAPGVGRIAAGKNSTGALRSLSNPNFSGISLGPVDPYSSPPTLPSTPTLEPSDDDLDDELLQKIADLEADKAHAVHSRETDLDRVSNHTREYLRQIGARRGNLPFTRNEVCLICVARDGRYFVEIVPFEQETENLYHTILELDETIFNLTYVIRKSGRMIQARKASFYISAVTATIDPVHRPEGRIAALATNVGCIYVDQSVPGLKAEIEELIRFRQGRGGMT